MALYRGKTLARDKILELVQDGRWWEMGQFTHRLKLGQATVRNGLLQLEEQGLIEIERQVSPGVPWRYRLAVGAVPESMKADTR